MIDFLTLERSRPATRRRERAMAGRTPRTSKPPEPRRRRGPLNTGTSSTRSSIGRSSSKRRSIGSRLERTTSRRACFEELKRSSRRQPPARSLESRPGARSSRSTGAPPGRARAWPRAPRRPRTRDRDRDRRGGGAGAGVKAIRAVERGARAREEGEDRWQPVRRRSPEGLESRALSRAAELSRSSRTS